jgi:hypothetical protein
MMRSPSSDLSGRRPIELDSGKTYDFSAPKKRAAKGMGISDEPVVQILVVKLV